MFPLWAGFCLIIFIECIIKRRFLMLGKYILGFCLGIVIIFIPIFIYLKLNGILELFFQQVVFGGAARGFDGGGLKELIKNFYIVLNRNLCILPLVIGLFWIITKSKQNNFSYYVGYTFSYLLMILFMSFSGGDNHYNMALIPFFIPALVFLTDIIYSAFSKIKFRSIILVLFFCFIFSEGILKYFWDILKVFHDKSGAQLIAAGKMIDQNTKPGDTIISLGFNGYIYPFTQRNSASRFFYQGSGLDHIKNASENFISDILSKKPAIISIFTAEAEDGGGNIMSGWHDPIFEMMKREYRLLSDENGYILYIRQ